MPLAFSAARPTAPPVSASTASHAAQDLESELGDSFEQAVVPGVLTTWIYPIRILFVYCMLGIYPPGGGRFYLLYAKSVNMTESSGSDWFGPVSFPVAPSR